MTYIKLHIFYFITNILNIDSPKLFRFQETYYENNYNPMPLLIYIHQFKDHPYPPNHIITKIINKFK